MTAYERVVGLLGTRAWTQAELCQETGYSSETVKNVMCQIGQCEDLHKQVAPRDGMKGRYPMRYWLKQQEAV